MIKISLTEGKKTVLDLSKVNNAFDRNVRIGLAYAGRHLWNKAKEGIKNPPKTGRIYRIKGRKRRASAPMEYPANQTGKLRRSLGYDVQGSHTLTVGSRDVEYSKFLEDGTVKMKKRPFLDNTVQSQKTEFVNILQSNIDKTFK